MINIVICDDDAYFVEILSNKISDFLDKNNIVHRIAVMYDGLDLFDYCNKNVADIVFADIDMPNMTGFEAVQRLQEQQPEIMVVFVTAHKELAYQAYDYHPYQFIGKNDLGKLDAMLKKLIKKIINIKQIDEVAHIHLDNSIIDIQVTEVMYFKSRRNYVSAFNSDGSIFELRANLKSVYEQLCCKGFVQVHRSYIIICRFICDFSISKIILKDNTQIPVTRNADMRKEAQKIYGRFTREFRC